MKRGSFGVSRLTRSLIYQPLAAFLAVLLVPTVSWFESTAGVPLGATARSFQSTAETIIQGCNSPRGNKIIQKVCAGGNVYTADLDQLESDAVTGYLATHELPAADTGLIYSAGRTDLRSEIRGYMMTILLGIIEKPANARTAHEQALYQWFRTLVQQNEIAEYTSALGEYRLWQENPCRYRLDPVIASQYGLSYNGPALCAPQSIAAAGPPAVPAASYFTAVGLKKSYGKPAETTPNFAAMVAQTQINVGAIIGIAAGAGLALATAAGVAIIHFLPQLFPFAFQMAEIVTEGWSFGSIFTSAVPSTTFAVTAGPAAVILICVIVAVMAGMQVFNNQQQLAELNNLTNVVAQVQNNAPDLNAFVSDTTGLGMFKLNATLVAQTLPEVPGTAALPGHRPGDHVFLVTPEGGTPGVQEAFKYDDWSGIRWSAHTSGGWLERECLGDREGRHCTQAESLTSSLQYVDWSEDKRIASRVGSNFVIAKASPLSTDKPCPADPASGVTPGTDFSQCSSYVAKQLHYVFQGLRYTLKLSSAPAFSSAATLSFSWAGKRQTAVVSAVGSPAPAISLLSPLPPGVEFQGGGGEAQLTYLGFTSGTAGSYPVTLRAANVNGSTGRTFTIVIAKALEITSPAAFHFPYGVPTSFLVTTTGAVPPALSMAPELLFPGLTFHDNGNGTATFSGTATQAGATKSGTCTTNVTTGQKICSGITASSPQGTVTQVVSVSVLMPPQPKLNVATASFHARIPNSFRVATSGTTAPVAFGFHDAGLSWLSFRNNGDGTAVLSGTPPVEATGVHTLYLYPYANAGLVLPPATAPFTLDVLGQPEFLNPNVASFTAGEASSFFMSTTDSGRVTALGTLPEGLELTAFPNGTASLTGVPARGTGGSHTLQLTLTNFDGKLLATQALNLQIQEAPAFTSAATANFYAGQANMFPVTVSGFPALSSAPVALSQTITGFVPGMEFTVTGLPASLKYSNLNPQGYNTGTLTLSGTPSSFDAGQHIVTITASNGIGGIQAKQTFTLRIAARPGDVNGDGAVTCTDVELVKASFGKYRGEPGYNPAADLNNDGVINVEDLDLVARNLPTGTVCP